MYIKKIVNYFLILLCAIIFCIAGFALGALYRAPKQINYSEINKQAEVDHVDLPEQQKEPATEAGIMQGQSLSAITLKIDDESLIIIDGDNQISRLAPPAFLPEAERQKLVEGISFSSLEEVEIYLESIDS